MSSIRTVQSERLLENLVHLLYSSGKQPMFSEIVTRMSQYFGEHPAGRPLPVFLHDITDGMIANPELYNKLLRNMAINVDVLYEASLRQVEDIMMLNDSLHSDLERLDKKRRRIETRIDDHLLSQSNTDGYFYSVSDNFSDIDMTNLYLTTGQIDVDVGAVMLPTVSSTTTRIPKELVSEPSISVTAGGESVDYVELAPFVGALEDSLDNMLWAFEVETDEPKEVIVEVTLSLGRLDPVTISRVDYKPYGATPVQVYLQDRRDNTWHDFGDKIQTGTTKMVFGTKAREVSQLRFTFRKTQEDYTENRNNTLRYKYLFGARDITFLYHVYENAARFVSVPLTLPMEYTYTDETAIDAVSIDVKADIPDDCGIRYYVAPTNFSEFGENDEFTPELPEIDDYVWQEILPIDSREPGDKFLRFNGAATNTSMIRSDPIPGDMHLISFQDSGPVQERNPTPSIIDGVNIFRIARMDVDPFKNSLELLEGVNTTRIYSRTIDQSVYFNEIDLDYWGNVFRHDEDSVTLDYGRIDTGDEFFYGGNIGAVGKDVYVEAYITCERSWPTFLKEFQKMDPRSRTWDTKVYLNGRPLGDLPPGSHRKQLPWNLREGLNHVVLLVRIPLTAGVSDSYIGAVSLLGDTKLYDYGSVHLSKWDYVDLFTMKYNESGRPTTFTIYNQEIISRRRPTTNYQLRYSTTTGTGPQGVIFRAEMERARNNPTVTPQLWQYRMRFSYTEDR